MPGEKRKDLPVLPPILCIDTEALFHNTEKADQWYQSIMIREQAIADVIRRTQATRYNRKEKPDEYIIVALSVKGDYRYQLTKFDRMGPVYDSQRDTPEEIAKEVPPNYVLTDLR